MPTLNDAIKQIVEEYLNNYQPADLVYGTWGGSSVKIDNKPIPIPLEMIDIPKNVTVTIGERVTLLQKRGGQKFALIGVL